MALNGRFDEALRDSVDANSILAIFDSSSVGLSFVDRDYRIVHINSALATVNGGAVVDQVGRLVSDVVPDIWPQLEPIYRRVIDHGEAVANVEVQGVTAADGNRGHHWLCSYYPSG
jgi:PAS domain-containing protein